MTAFDGKGKVKDAVCHPTPESEGFTPLGGAVAKLRVECPACSGFGGGEVEDGAVYECDACYGTGRMNLKEAETWLAKNRPWTL